MTDYENNSVNEENNSQNPTSSRILSRLLKRKSSSGVVIPKIRSKIAQITKNSQKFRNQHLDLPGNARRERIKIFGDELRSNKKTKTSTSEVKKSSQSSWENMEMFLPNGTSVESSRPNISQTSMEVPSGLPTGGQVIAPFNPPPTSEGEPSFVARRRARLNAQEEKKTKPQTKKPDLNMRPRSRVEEIIPANRQPAEKPKEMSEPIGREKNTLTKPVKETTQPKEQKPRDESKAQRPSQIEEIKPSVISEKSAQEKTVQRQFDKSSDERLKEESGTVADEKSRDDQTQSTTNVKLPPTVTDDLKTLVRRKTSSTEESKEVKSFSPDIEKATDKKSKNMGSQNKEAQSRTSQLEILEKKPEPKLQVEKTEKPELGAPKDLSLPKTETEKRKNVEEKAEEKPAISKMPSSKIQREFDPKETKEVEKSKEPETIIPSDEKEKLDLPLVDKGKTKTTANEQKDSQQKITKLITTESSEKQQPVPSETAQPKHQVKAKPEDDRIVEDTTSKKKISTDKQRVSDDQLSETIKKPLLINKRIDLPLLKSTKNQQIKKSKQISRVLKTAIFKPVSDKSNVISSEKTLIQRQMVSSSEKTHDQPRKEDEKAIGDPGKSKILKQTPQEIEPQKISSEGSNELQRQSSPENPREEMVVRKEKQSISPRNIPERIFKPVIKSQKRTEPIHIPKKDSLSIINRSLLPTRESDIQSHKFTSPAIRQPISMDSRVDGSTGREVSQRISPQSIEEKPGSQPIERNLVQRIKELSSNTGKQELPIHPTPSIQDRLLVTSSGRKIIKNKIEKSIQKLDIKQNSEDKLPFIIPLRSENDMKNIGKPNEFSPRKSESRNAVPEGIKTSKTPGKSAMPVHKQAKGKAPEKITKSPEIELPVLQTKKMERQEKYFEPDFSVQGPVVQRMITESNENSSDLSQSVMREETKIDLEKLAKDVYPIIKRWIAIEKERTSGRLY